MVTSALSPEVESMKTSSQDISGWPATTIDSRGIWKAVRENSTSASLSLLDADCWTWAVAPVSLR